MQTIRRGLSSALLLLFLLVSPAAADGNWPSFRGPGALGVADGTPLPTTWNGETGEGISWKTPIPGLGHSSPVVWGDKIYVTTAIAADEAAGSSLKVGLYGDIAAAEDMGLQSWRLFCLDKKTGEVLWQKTLHEGTPAIKRHTKATHANSTPATDGQRFAVFLGSQGLHVLDMEGKPLWKKDFGKLKSSFFMVPAAEWGFAASPILHEDKLIVQVDVLGDSFVAAFNADNGEEIWRTKRDDYPTWSTPAVAPHGDGLQVVVNGYKHRGGYDYATGAELWKMSGGGDIPVPTPFVAHDLIFFSSAHGAEAPVIAIKPGATGDLTPDEEGKTGDGVAWLAERSASYMPTPIVYGDLLYVGRDAGILVVFDAKSGEEVYKERLAKGPGFTASPVAGDGKLYFPDENGVVYVVQAGKTFEKLAQNPLGETVLASPAISDGKLYFRARSHLFAVGGDTGAAPEASEAETSDR